MSNIIAFNMDYGIEHACACILLVWDQYHTGRVTDNGAYFLSHECMSAGQTAGDFLENYGYAIDGGLGIYLTRKGLILNQTPEYKGIDEV